MQMPPGIHVEWVDDEAVVLNEKTSELHYLNPESALVYALLLEFGMPRALEEASRRMETSTEQVHAYVHDLIETFVAKGILAGGPA